MADPKRWPKLSMDQKHVRDPGKRKTRTGDFRALACHDQP